MGSCFSFLEKDQNASNIARRMSNVYPGQFIEFKILPSDKHDDKFYSIKNEEEIDLTIDHLDEVITMNEMKAEILEHTIAGLRHQKSRFTAIRSYDSVDEFTPVRELEEEEEESPGAKRKVGLEKGDVFSRRRSHTIQNFAEISASRETKDINHIVQGTLLIEVQKGMFLHPSFIKKYSLCDPYVVLKIYHTNKTKIRDYRQKADLNEMARFETGIASEFVRPEWDQIFEYMIKGEKKASNYSFGVSLFYKFNAEQANFQVGEEQIFSVYALLDQKVQIKYIDFKDPEVKGVLARVRVRFQFLYDIELAKEKLIREIKAKMERLTKIREKCLVFQGEKKGREVALYSIKRQASKAGSEFSQSSTHENEEESEYFINEY